jgi:hypothetical protein
MSNSVSDLLHAGSDRIRPTLPSAQSVRSMAERRRRNRRVAAIVTPAVLATLIFGLNTAGQLRNSATPPSPAQPGPRPVGGLLRIAADPFTEFDGLPVRASASPAALSGCVSSPLTWGAVESRWATYGHPGHRGRVYNEFVLRFDSVAAAHRAVLDAWRQFRQCPTPPNVATDPWNQPTQVAGYGLREQFANQRARFATAAFRGQPVSMYALRVGRRENVVVAIEDRGDPDDRAAFVLELAMSRAVWKP